jgi:hypothetical protein
MAAWQAMFPMLCRCLLLGRLLVAPGPACWQGLVLLAAKSPIPHP